MGWGQIESGGDDRDQAGKICSVLRWKIHCALSAGYSALCSRGAGDSVAADRVYFLSDDKACR